MRFCSSSSSSSRAGGHRRKFCLITIALISQLVSGFSITTTTSTSTATTSATSSTSIATRRTTRSSGGVAKGLSNNMSSSSYSGIQPILEYYRGGALGGTTTTRRGSSSSTTKVAASTSSSSSSTSSPYDTGSKCPVTGSITALSSLWATGGVLYILAKAIKRVLPIALEPFQEGSVPLSQFQLGIYIITCIWFAYVEGYKGFQLKFSPLVVKRSFTLIPGKNGTTWYHYILAPLYSMGLIHATKKRKIVSWSVTIGVTMIVAIVKRLPYPYRNIIDAGVVIGLSYGALSILIMYLYSWLTGMPPSNTDAALPASTTTTKTTSK